MKLPSAAELTGSNPDHPETQSATIARLEGERDQAWSEFQALSVRGGADVQRLEGELAEARGSLVKIKDWASKSTDLVTCTSSPWDLMCYTEALRALAGASVNPDKFDAEALRALAAWVNADKGWRRVSGICIGERFAFEVTVRFWRGTDGQQEVRGEADTLAAAIMDALGKCKC